MCELLFTEASELIARSIYSHRIKGATTNPLRIQFLLLLCITLFKHAFEPPLYSFLIK